MSTDNRLEDVRESLYAMYDALDESWRAIGRESGLSDEEKKKKRKAIKDEKKKLELKEAKINLAAIKRREKDQSLDSLIERLNGATKDANREIDRMREATQVARNVTKVLSAATTMVGIVADIIV